MRDSLKEKPLKDAHLTICISKTLLTSSRAIFASVSPLVGCEKNDQRSKKEKRKEKVKEEREEEGREFPGAVAFLSLVKF